MDKKIHLIPPAMMDDAIREALGDPRPEIPADAVFDRLERQHAKRMKSSERGGA
ncbi:hypothetical protein [Phyllobacterium leguminum]|uniref:hypothetical protein n=1 Tax=Phyllobacterium leguminum TaxID=314237 RepID=UPI0015E8D7FC|nr:hypothetical protein [Phyllobacterium leguminum]